MNVLALVAMAVPIAIEREEARRRALKELAKAKYGGTPSWLTRLLDWVGERIERLLELYLRYLSGRQEGGFSWGFVLAIALMLAAIGLVVWRVGLPRWRRRQSEGAVVVDPTRAAADYRDLAERYAAGGDWQLAVRDRFRAIVRELEIRTILDVRPARTAWEAARSASEVLPSCRQQLDVAAETFNAVVYGAARAGPDTYAELVTTDQAVQAAADRADLSDTPAKVVAR